jgi:hypothetical protein
MAVVLDFDGVRFWRQGQALLPGQVARWLRCLRPCWVEVRFDGGRRQVSCERLLQQLDPTAAASGVAAQSCAQRQTEPDPLEDAYRSLGLGPGAGAAAVKRAYRRQARLHHPDRGGSLRAMQELNGAYCRLEAALSASIRELALS